MPGIKYITRVLRGVRFEKLNYVMGVVKQKSGHSKARTFCDILWCAARYGAGYYDYVMFGFYDMNGKQRDTYLTRVRNKKVCELMNQPGYGDEFDDKLRFNVRFADFLGRRTLNAAAATPDELSAFLQGLDCFFAKPSRGTCGNGIEKLRTADWPDAEKLLAYLKEKGLDVLEAAMVQELQRTLNDFLRAQPEDARRFFLRRYWYGESIAEIAEACGASSGRIRSSLFRTRARLRRRLEEEGVFL